MITLLEEWLFRKLNLTEVLHHTRQGHAAYWPRNYQQGWEAKDTSDTRYRCSRIQVGILYIEKPLESGFKTHIRSHFLQLLINETFLEILSALTYTWATFFIYLKFLIADLTEEVSSLRPRRPWAYSLTSGQHFSDAEHWLYLLYRSWSHLCNAVNCVFFDAEHWL